MVTDYRTMKKAMVVIGITLVLAGAIILAYDTSLVKPPLLGVESGQVASVNYLAFFGFALGGGGFLVLLFSVFQWYVKRRLK
jgi:ABC-type cobalamin transport system permease subunit